VITRSDRDGGVGVGVDDISRSLLDEMLAETGGRSQKRDDVPGDLVEGLGVLEAPDRTRTPTNPGADW
jgi:hypothetical protein